jgi:TPR repeat protein
MRTGADVEKQNMNRSFIHLIAIIGLVFTGSSYAGAEAMFQRDLAGAQQGDVEAQYDVAYRYEKGRGVDEDEDLAFEWFHKAAELGMDKAQYKLGLFYLRGIGTDSDTGEAIAWLRKSADQGYAPAQYQLGKLYASAAGGRKYKRAQGWLQKARDNGYEPATTELIRLKRKLN